MSRRNKPDVVRLVENLKSRGCCAEVFVDGFNEEVICMLRVPCEKHTVSEIEKAWVRGWIDAHDPDGGSFNEALACFREMGL